MVRCIRELAEQRPDDDVYIHIGMDGTERTLRWPELHELSTRLAGALAARGLGFGDRLGLGLRNSPHFVLGVFAAWKLGAGRSRFAGTSPTGSSTALRAGRRPRVLPRR